MRSNNDLIIGTQSSPGAPVVGIPANANINSNPQWLTQTIRASFQVVVTGTIATGTLQLQVSDDQAVGAPANQFVPTNWFNLGSSVAVAAAGAFMVPAISGTTGYIETGYEYARLVWTDTSGGTNNGTVVARMKSLGIA